MSLTTLFIIILVILLLGGFATAADRATATDSVTAVSA